MSEPCRLLVTIRDDNRFFKGFVFLCTWVGIAGISDAITQNASFLWFVLWLGVVFCFGWGIYNIFGPGKGRPSLFYVAVSVAARSWFVPLSMICAGMWAFSVPHEYWWKYALLASAHGMGRIAFAIVLQWSQKDHWKKGGG